MDRVMTLRNAYDFIVTFLEGMVESTIDVQRGNQKLLRWVYVHHTWQIKQGTILYIVCSCSGTQFRRVRAKVETRCTSLSCGTA